jgi:hypothetical protein
MKSIAIGMRQTPEDTAEADRLMFKQMRILATLSHWYLVNAFHNAMYEKGATQPQNEI